MQTAESTFLSGYTKHFSWAECRSREGCLQCMAHLDSDISEVIPYLNSELNGFLFLEDPLSFSFRMKEKVVVVFHDRIGINMVRDENEADEILDLVCKKINEVWSRRFEIEPLREATPQPNVVEILRILQGISCSDCEASCLVFAVQLAGGEKNPEDCPKIPEEKRRMIREYLNQPESELNN